MTALAEALAYAAGGLPVFPCRSSGPKRKDPLTAHGFHDASCDPSIISSWWARWPTALIGMPTGPVSGRNVLDIDVKHAHANGFDSLAELGWAILPVTPVVHTASGGLHLHFAAAGPEIRNTNSTRGQRGIGPGLDWRGTGGYVILPADDSGYSWDPYCGADTPLAAVPAELLPREPKAPASSPRPVTAAHGLSPYAEAAIDSACRAILAAPAGEQECTLVAECFSIGTLVAAGGAPHGFARDTLRWAARQLTSYDPRRAWHPAELERKVDRAFTAGLAHPRGARHHG